MSTTVYTLNRVKKPKDYKAFIYSYEGMLSKDLEIPTIEKASIIAKSHPVEADS